VRHPRVLVRTGAGTMVARNVVLVSFNADATDEQRRAAIQSVRGCVVGGWRVEGRGIWTVRLPDETTRESLWTAVLTLASRPIVDFAMDHAGIGFDRASLDTAYRYLHGRDTARVVFHTFDGGLRYEGVTVVRDEPTWRAVLERSVPPWGPGYAVSGVDSLRARQVDFAREMVVLASSVEPVTGDWLTIEWVRPERDSLVVAVRQWVHGPGHYLGSGLTTPAHSVRVPRDDRPIAIREERVILGERCRAGTGCPRPF
jgi:hypothetical protein